MRFLTVAISGLPIIISNVARPSKWSTGSAVYIGGESYTWHPALLTDGGVRGFTDRMEIWGGCGQPDTVTLRCRATPELLALTNRSQSYPALIEDLDTAATAAEVDDADYWSTGGVAYVSDETIGIKGGSGTTLDPITRGRYRSIPRYHVAEWDGVSERDYAGADVAPTPLTHRGRICWVHSCPAVSGPSGVVPESASAPDGEDGTNWLAMTGVVQRLEAVGAEIEIEICDLTHLLDRPVVSRQPQARVGHGDLVQVDEWSIRPGLRLSTGPWLHDDLDLAGPLHTAREVAEAVEDGLSDTVGTVEWGVEILRAGRSWQVVVSTDAALATVPDLIFEAGPRTIWRELGLESDTIVEGVSVGSGTEWTLVIDRPRPLLRLPPGDALRTIWLSSARLPSVWPGDGQGWVGADATALPELVRVGDELMAVTELTETVDGRTWHGIAPSRRGLRGTRSTEEVYYEDALDADPVLVTGGLGLSGCEWPRAILYAMCAGYYGTGDYDGVGQRGIGACLPESLVDVTGIEALMQLPGGTDKIDLWGEEARPLRDVLSPILVARGCYLHTSGGLLSVEQIPAIVEDASAIEIGPEQMSSVTGLSWSQGEANVRNLVKAVKLAGSDSTATYIAGSSRGTWPEAPAIEIAIDWHDRVSRADAEAARAAGGLLGLWSRPHARVALAHRRSSAWDLRLGQAVLLTHRLGIDAGQRGVDRLPGRIVELTPQLIGPLAASLVVVCPGRGGARPCYYSPCARGTAVSAYSGGVCTITTTENYYAPSSTGVADAQRFADGDYVRVYTEGDEGGAVECRVAAAPGATSIVVAGDCSSLDTPVIIESDIWDDVQPEQQANAYAADGTARPWLMTDATTPPATYAP